MEAAPISKCFGVRREALRHAAFTAQFEAGKRCCRSARPPQSKAGGFTRLDLLAVVAGLVVLAGCLAGLAFGERGRTARCARNLAVLGQAMQSFAADHQGGLPPAYAGPLEVPWSFLVVPYVRPGVAGSNSAAARWEWEEGIADRLVCPSDRLLRGYPRTYAMPAHDMRVENWPPSGAETCGVGLVWNANTLKRLLNREAATGAPVNVTGLALIKPAQLSDPANTLLLTELVHPDNKLKSGIKAAVNGPDDQVEAFKEGLGTFHRGRFNYLMVDGHVERLQPYQAEAFNGTAGIWSMKPGD